MLDLVTALKALVDESYGRGHSSEALTYAAAVLSDYGLAGPDFDRYALIAAKGLKELDIETRESFQEQLALPKPVMSHLLMDSPAPEARVAQLPLVREETPDLAKLRQSMRAKVDREAEEQRQRYVTGGSAQAMVYLYKFAEAERYLKQGADSGPFPLLQAEVGVTAATLAGVANTVLQLAGHWSQKAADIEKKRLQAKKNITAASDNVGAIKAAGTVQW